MTARECEVLARVLAGQSSKVIAAALGVSERVVSFHRQNIRRTFHGASFVVIARRTDAQRREVNP